MFWLAGQQTRIVVRTPADCGELEVNYPNAIALFGRWPHKTGDTTQRFYFRATAPVTYGRMLFRSGKHEMALPVTVIPWSQALKAGRFEFEGLRLPRIFPMEGQDETKPGMSFLRQADLDRLRSAGAGTPEQVARIVASLPDDGDAFYRLPESTIPRAVFVQKRNPKGCPICGRKIFEGRSPFYPWLYGYHDHPYQVQCPECKRWFPDNDFGKEDMTSGKYADDGWGYIDSTGDPFGFVAYYNQYCYRQRYQPAICQYAELYARTGHRRIGRTAALMLFRVAEQYLNLALNVNQRKRYMRSAVWNGSIIPQTDLKL